MISSARSSTPNLNPRRNPNSLTQVKEVLWDCHDLLSQIFDFYSSVSGAFGTISLNQ